MAFEWMAWAVKQKTEKPVSKSVLIALANYADEEGFCYPSITRLCEVTECCEKAVRNAIKHLEAIGLLRKGKRRRRKDGTLGVQEYYLTSGTMCQKPEVSNTEPQAPDTTSPEVQDTAQNQSLPKPIKNTLSGCQKPEQKKSKKPHRLPDDWFCSEDLGNWAMKNGLTDEEVVLCIDQFKDHYAAAAGKGSTALDWDAKFRTWIRNEVKWKK